MFFIKLDIYKPENNSENGFELHGDGFNNRYNPDIVEMANFYASRGWVFISIDYRTTEELGNTQGMNEEEVLTYYRGLWLIDGLILF